MKTTTPTKGADASLHSPGSFFGAEGDFFSSSKEAREPFFPQAIAQPKSAAAVAEPINETDELTDKDKKLKRAELAVEPRRPDAVARVLTDTEIADAIAYNQRRFTNVRELRVLRDVLGLAPEPAVIDAEFVQTVAQWQAENELTEDGKVGPRTAAVIGFEMLEESKTVPELEPDAVRMLERGIVISLPGNTYTDTATESRKNITFSVFVPRGLRRQDYVLVNWLRGHMRAGDGSFFQVTMYGTAGDANWPNFQVDSVDADPIYWSEPGNRWPYDTVGSRSFTATDSPGPALNTEVGADYDVRFRIQVYRLADLPLTTAGNLGGVESRAIATAFWDYRVQVSAAGAFTHN